MSDSEQFQRVKATLAPRMAERNAGFWCPDGWLGLVLDTDARLAAVNPDYRIVEVKEKLGMLRFSVAPPVTEPLREVIQDAESTSVGICQNCGASGAGSVDGGFIATLCDACIRSDDWDTRGY